MGVFKRIFSKEKKETLDKERNGVMIMIEEIDKNKKELFIENVFGRMHLICLKKEMV